MTLAKLSLIGFLLCLIVLGSAYYLEYQYMLAACPLCILQRIIFAALAIIFLSGILLKFNGWVRYAYSGSIIFIALSGAGLAGRQLWLQYFAPPQLVSCSASIQRIFEIYPLLDSFKMILAGTGDCATIDFTILGLSIAAWSFVLFAGITTTALWVVWLQKKRRI